MLDRRTGLAFVSAWGGAFMIRMFGFVGSLLTLIMMQISTLSAFELEGIVDQPPRVSAVRVSFAVPTSGTIVPEKRDCLQRQHEVRIREVAFCRVRLDAGTQAPSAQPGLLRYRVLVESGLEDRARRFADRVDTILGLDTGWARNGIRFARVVEGYDFTVVLARPGSVDRLCRPLQTRGWLSCAMWRTAVINAKRWREGAKTWGQDVLGYHHYLVNHEVGHVLGLRHVKCPGAGAPAPIMLQQTIFLKGCLANGAATPTDVRMLMAAMPRIKRRFASLRAPGASKPGASKAVRAKQRSRRHRRKRVRKSRRRLRSALWVSQRRTASAAKAKPRVRATPRWKRRLLQ